MSRRQQGKQVQKGGAHIASAPTGTAESGNLESKEVLSGVKAMEQEGASKGMPLQEKGLEKRLGTEKGNELPEGTLQKDIPMQEKALGKGIEGVQGKELEKGMEIEKGKGLEKGMGLEAGKGLEKGKGLETGKDLEAGKGLEKGMEIEKGKGLEKGKELEKGKGKEEGNVIGIDVPRQESGGSMATGTSANLGGGGGGGVQQGLNLGKRPADESLIDPREAGPKPPFPEQQQGHTGASHKMSPVPDYGEQSYRGLGRLQDRIALVTGGDSGIGRAVCLAFAREGAHVICSYLQNHKDAEETKALIESSGRQALLVAGDIGDDAHCQKLIKQIVDKFGRLDILVNNAGFQRKAVENMEDLDAATVEKTFKTNIISMFSLVRLSLPHMKPGSSIINVSSIQAFMS
jgi:hypothetical protein